MAQSAGSRLEANVLNFFSTILFGIAQFFLIIPILGDECLKITEQTPASRFCRALEFLLLSVAAIMLFLPELPILPRCTYYSPTCWHIQFASVQCRACLLLWCECTLWVECPGRPVQWQGCGISSTPVSGAATPAPATIQQLSRTKGLASLTP